MASCLRPCSCLFWACPCPVSMLQLESWTSLKGLAVEGAVFSTWCCYWEVVEPLMGNRRRLGHWVILLKGVLLLWPAFLSLLPEHHWVSSLLYHMVIHNVLLYHMLKSRRSSDPGLKLQNCESRETFLFYKLM